MARNEPHRRVLVTATMATAVLVTTSSALADCPADWNGDNILTVQDLFDFLEDYFGGDADYNEDGSTTLQDLFDFLGGWFGGCSFGPALTVSPTSGTLGTVVTITVNPVVAPRVFGPNSTAVWSGRFVGTTGGVSELFTIRFDADALHEISTSQAEIVVGTGLGAIPSALGDFGTGELQGTLTVVFDGSAAAAAPIAFTPVTGGNTVRSILYSPSGPGGIDPPQLGPEPSTAVIYRLSLLPNSTTPTVEQLFAARGAHLTPVFRAARNASSASAAPSVTKVDVVSYDSDGFEIERIADVVLNRLTDSDPLFINYAATLTKPLILIDVNVDRQAYPQFYLLTVAVGGSIAVVPSSEY